MSKRTKVLQWFVIGCGSLLILVIISASLLSRRLEQAWETQLATMMATDSSISAFGDDAHAVQITPGSALKVGETGTIFGMEITLDNAGFLKPAENVVGDWEYWFVEFTGKNISNEIQYGINPDVEAQLQYLQGNSYIWMHRTSVSTSSTTSGPLAALSDQRSQPRQERGAGGGFGVWWLCPLIPALAGLHSKECTQRKARGASRQPLGASEITT